MPTILAQPLVEAEIATDGTTPLPGPLDLGDWPTLEIVVRVLRAGVATPTEDGQPTNAPVLVLQHAPTADAVSLLDLPTPVAVDLCAEGTTWIHVPYFTAWIHPSVSGSLDEPAQVSVEILGKR